MKITQIKQQVKNLERVSIFLDNKYSFSLTLDQLLAERLKKDDELDDLRIAELKKLSDEGKLRARALEWVMGRPHSTRELRDYLYRKKAEKELIEALIEEFTIKKYIHDENFARWFTEGRMRKNKSERTIKAELRAKGIDSETIGAVFSEVSIAEDEMARLRALVLKLQGRSRYQDPKKMTAYLMSKGFTYTDIKECLSGEITT